MPTTNWFGGKRWNHREIEDSWCDNLLCDQWLKKASNEGRKMKKCERVNVLCSLDEVWVYDFRNGMNLYMVMVVVWMVGVSSLNALSSAFVTAYYKSHILIN